jgi:16S rRNA (adenine1518-N6/adenine1519-N6)-dimethyltransferase
VGARLGQHFLFDPAILGRIADAALLTPRDVVLEIGPGRGTLTRHLAARARRVVAIEADARLAAALRAAPPADNVEVLDGDALTLPWPRADVVCGNIPYQITSPLIERALTPPRPRCIVFLIQREVADRLAAGPGSRTYGALSAGVQLVADVERLFGVRAGAFRPPPRVESALVRITPREVPLVAGGAEEQRVRAVIRLAFAHRRRQLQRTLREDAGLDALGAARLLEGIGLSPAVRAEQLGPAEFVALARALPRSLQL